MKQISSILPHNCSIKYGEDTNILGIAFDSRKVEKGFLFVAVKGVFVDGHDFIGSAIKKGAVAILCETIPQSRVEGVVYIVSSDSKTALADIASNWYEYPSENMKMIGIGGTNGKTTIATLLFDLYTQLGYKVGLISTVNYRFGGKIFESTHTTPDVLSLNRILSEMVDNGCTHVFMEVSSHAIHQDRLGGLKFDIGVFSNITPEHLDYHKTFKEYIAVKKKFFDDLEVGTDALVNIDDKNGLVMVQNSKASKHTYAIKRPAEFKGKVLSNLISGLVMQIDGNDIHFRLPGLYNGYNLLAVYGVANILGDDRQEVLRIMSNLSGAEGRFDIVRTESSDITGIIDYAHTPDALSKVIAAINQLKSKNSRLISVFGCGGDRDKTKRPIMADIGSRDSDIAILTSDNPRTENPDLIIAEMEKGIKPENEEKAISITNRRQAIKTAVKLAKNNDIILIAGKGHEKYQDIMGEKIDFDDKKILHELLLNSKI